MESLSDSIAEVASIILTLTRQSSTPEIDGQIRCLNQKFAVIQERNQELNDVWKLKNEEIDDLHEQVDKLKGESTVWEVKFSTAESARKYDELCTALESKNTKIKELEKQVDELKAEKEILKERLETLENDLQKVKRTNTSLERKNLSLDREMKYLKDELDDVKVENRTLKKNELISATERQTLQVDVCDLKKINSSLQKSHSSLKQSHSSLKQSHSSLQESHSSLQESNTTLKKSVQKLETDNTTLKRKVEDLERKIDVPDDDLILGQLCHRVQSMIFKKILPQDLYDDKESYKIKHMGEHFRELFGEDEREINAANQTWAELQKALKWEERDVDKITFVMKKIQSGRNAVAHPELTPEILTAATQRLKDAGRLTGSRKPDNIQELVRVWKQLKEMA